MKNVLHSATNSLLVSAANQSFVGKGGDEECGPQFHKFPPECYVFGISSGEAGLPIFVHLFYCVSYVLIYGRRLS